MTLLSTQASIFVRRGFVKEFEFPDFYLGEGKSLIFDLFFGIFDIRLEIICSPSSILT